MGNLTVTGVANSEIYNTVVGGRLAVAETVNPNGQDHVLLGNDTVGKDLFVATYGAVNDVFVDFSSVAGSSSIKEDSGKNVIGLESNLFYGPTTLSQLNGSESLLSPLFLPRRRADHKQQTGVGRGADVAPRTRGFPKAALSSRRTERDLSHSHGPIASPPLSPVRMR